MLAFQPGGGERERERGREKKTTIQTTMTR